MTILRQHIDALFARYKKTPQILDLKEEMLGNLEARVNDLTAQGMSYEEAAQQAIRDLRSVEHLIDGNQRIYKNRFLVDLIQYALLYAALIWVVCIPFGVVSRTAGLASFWLPVLIALLAIAYLVMSRRRRESEFWSATCYINTAAARRNLKIAWIVWTLFVLAAAFTTTGVHFASNIWYGYPARVEGPYQYATLIAEYLLPVLTIAVPLLFQTAVRLIEKHEAGDPIED